MTTNAEQDDQPVSSLYADEVLCANWHPLVLLLAEPLVRAQKKVFDAAEAEDFLARLYLGQRA